MQKTITKRLKISTKRASRFARNFCANNDAATSIEYGLLAMLLAVACITAFTSFGSSSNGGWGNLANKVGNNLN